MKPFLNLQFFAEGAETASEPAEKAVEIAKTEKTYTASEVDKIIADRLAREREKARKEQKKADEAKKFEAMSEAERTASRMKELEEKLAKFERESNLSSMQASARKILAEQDIHVSDAILSRLVSEDAEETKEAVTAFANEFKKSVEAGVGKRVKGTTPKKGESASKLTKEEILKVKDRTKRQALIKQNLSLFK